MAVDFWLEGAAAYATFRPSYPACVARVLAAHCPQKLLAVDVGCGSGQLTALLADCFKDVEASDVSAEQLAHAVRRDNIRYRVGAAEKIALGDGVADLIVAAQAAHWFDLPAFYNEVRRIAAPGGVIALVTYGIFEAAGDVNERLQHFYWDEMHAFWPAGRENVENGYRDIDFPFTPIPLSDFAADLVIEREWGANHFMQYCETWSATKRARAAGRGDIVAKMRHDLEHLLGAAGRMRLRWPIAIKAGRVG